ncbi:MAG: 1-acyl-sn-glycerol-3-phosphate acyltransferase, partial [Saprospiraceae bacterium]|nr:1-acyl-sn-glycerol-3-phosphate acyltransferase [Saprospiraceae bacterium]
LYFAIYTSMCIAQMVVVGLLPGATVFKTLHIRQRWIEHLLPAIGIRVTVQGAVPDFPCILMGNHRSYLDPALIVRYVLYSYPVSKAEVAKWPIIGYGTRITGVLFLQRESRESRRETLQGIAEKVRAGFPVILFPEGTTQAAPQTIRFSIGGFKLAAAAGIPIVPVAVEYRDPADYWVGEDSFLAHFLRRFRQKHMDACLHFGPALQHEDPEWLLKETQKWIDRELLQIAPGF